MLIEPEKRIAELNEHTPPFMKLLGGKVVAIDPEQQAVLLNSILRMSFVTQWTLFRADL